VVQGSKLVWVGVMCGSLCLFQGSYLHAPCSMLLVQNWCELKIYHVIYDACLVKFEARKYFIGNKDHFIAGMKLDSGC
jgi:hypothetical protein